MSSTLVTFGFVSSTLILMGDKLATIIVSNK